MNKKLLIISGPTATGKTNLALQLAKVFNGQLISADSRQVYKGMDIGTGKDQPSGVEILGYDLVSPNEDFSVADFVKFAWDSIHRLWQDKKVPIVVGGTGLYLKHLLHPAPSLFIPPSSTLRRRLDQLTTLQLQTKLQKLQPHRWQAMNRSDRHNPRRLIRAIEVGSDRQLKPLTVPKPDSLWLGLTAPLSILDQRINQRVVDRIDQGMTPEVKALIKKYPNWNYPAFSATGYAYWRQFIEGKITPDEAIKLWQTSERQYARRQLTWFNKQPQIHWFDITHRTWQNKATSLVKTWLHGSSSKN